MDLFKKPKKLKFILLGPKDSGKTTILYKQQLHKTIETMPTSDFYTEDLSIATKEHHKTKCSVLDVGGAVFDLWLGTPEELDGIIWVQDATDSKTLDETVEMFDKVIKHPKTDGVPLLVFANKSESDGAMKPEELSAKLHLKDLKRKVHILPCCATSGHNIEAGFHWITDASLEFKATKEKSKKK